MKKIIFTGRLLAASVAAGLVLAPAAADAAAHTSIQLQRAVEIGLPPNIQSTAEDSILAVSCSQAGSCTAGGVYDGSVSQAFVVTESNGHWRTPRSLVMPPEGNFEPPGQVDGIACTTPGNCVAVGLYFVGQPITGSLPFVAGQSHGTWGEAHTIKLPKGALEQNAFSGLNSVSCPAPGSCFAVGVYEDNLGHEQAMRVTETKGKWAQAVRLGEPVNVGKDPKAFMGQMSCTKSGSCVAVGSYLDTGGNTQAVVFSRSGGKWHSGAEVKLPGDAASDPKALLNSASCPATGPCTAVGNYQNSKAVAMPMTMTVSGGKLSAARAVTLVPAGASAQPAQSFWSVACPAAGACVAAGRYKTSAGRLAPMLLTQSGGKWTSAASIGLPKDASTSVMQFATPRSATCTSTGYCAVVGIYLSTTAGRSFAATTKP
ncbi:MAG TPA: hypothetical protein VFI65_07340 [Streptosporangiaceae bacterium]|nr:hypothetical protein [Streptosporangiaceae bacterium]